MHGVADSADCWVVNSKEKAPALVAASEGYDVWLGNFRGNKYSRANRNLDPDEQEKQFWDFSFTEMSDQDVVSMVDYIKTTTRYTKVGYIGHSMATTAMFYLGASQPDYYQQSISVFIALGPVTRPTHIKEGLLHVLVEELDRVSYVLDSLSIYEMFKHRDHFWEKRTLELVCGYMTWFCEYASTFIATDDLEYDNDEAFQVYVGHYPTSTSTKSFLHLGQMMKADTF